MTVFAPENGFANRQAVKAKALEEEKKPRQGLISFLFIIRNFLFLASRFFKKSKLYYLRSFSSQRLLIKHNNEQNLKQYFEPSPNFY